MPTYFEASAEIEAPVERVWAVLVDLANYPAWNTFTPKVISTLEPGSPAVLHVKLGEKKIVQRLTVNSVSPNDRFSWGSTVFAAPFFKALRWQIVEPAGEGRSRYRTYEHFTGLIAPAIAVLYGADIRRGFEDVARGLKRRVESLAAR